MSLRVSDPAEIRIMEEEVWDISRYSPLSVLYQAIIQDNLELFKQTLPQLALNEHHIAIWTAACCNRLAMIQYCAQALFPPKPQWDTPVRRDQCGFHMPSMPFELPPVDPYDGIAYAAQRDIPFLLRQLSLDPKMRAEGFGEGMAPDLFDGDAGQALIYAAYAGDEMIVRWLLEDQSCLESGDWGRAVCAVLERSARELKNLNGNGSKYRIYARFKAPEIQQVKERCQAIMTVLLERIADISPSDRLTAALAALHLVQEGYDAQQQQQIMGMLISPDMEEEAKLIMAEEIGCQLTMENLQDMEVILQHLGSPPDIALLGAVVRGAAPKSSVFYLDHLIIVPEVEGVASAKRFLDVRQRGIISREDRLAAIHSARLEGDQSGVYFLTFTDCSFFEKWVNRFWTWFNDTFHTRI